VQQGQWGTHITQNSEIRLSHSNFLTFDTIQIFSVIVQKYTTFELGIVVIRTHEPPSVQMKIFLEVFVGFDGL